MYEEPDFSAIHQFWALFFQNVFLIELVLKYNLIIFNYITVNTTVVSHIQTFVFS